VTGSDPVLEDAVVYARYSSHAQRDASIEEQVADCEVYARLNGLRIVKVYADRHLTGKNDNRPQFQQMMKDAAHGRWRYVIIWKTDRFARNRYDSATYKYRLKRHGVRVLSAKESIPDGPEGILLESVLEGSAEYYSANLAQNIKRGMHYNALDCKVNSGSVPFGYCKGPDGRFAVQEAEAEVVREIFRKAAAGTPFVEIANDLNGRGIRTKRGGRWGKGSFHRMLQNESYTGVYRFGDVRVEGGMPAIIDQVQFLQVQRVLTTKKNPQGRHRENGEYLLTGKLYCALCGSPMVGVAGTGKSGALHHYYACQKRRTAKACKKENVRREWIERVVTQATLDYVLQPAVIEWIADAVMAYQDREAAGSQLGALHAQLDENAKATGNIMKAIEAGIITASTKGRLLELEAEAARLKNAIALEEASLTKLERDFVVYWLERFRDGNIESQEFRRKVIDSFVAAVYLSDDFIRIAFNYSGKNNEVSMALVMDAAESAGAEGSFKVENAPPMGGQANPATIYFVGTVFVLAMPLPLKR
jgi:DNA invertase Pin-like site-specific DNA recombinase